SLDESNLWIPHIGLAEGILIAIGGVKRLIHLLQYARATHGEHFYAACAVIANKPRGDRARGGTQTLKKSLPLRLVQSRTIQDFQKLRIGADFIHANNF